MRNRTVQSVLARRSMNNGGMVAPPTQASGILRSSPSLIDAVSNDALSDMGGGTLSMAQGGAAVNMQPSYVFNQGGIARFAPGGAAVKPIPYMPNINLNMAEVDDDSSQFTIDSRNRAFLREALMKKAIDENAGKNMSPLISGLTGGKPVMDAASDAYNYMFGSAADQPKRDAERLELNKERARDRGDSATLTLDTYLSQVGAPEDVISYYQQRDENGARINVPKGVLGMFDSTDPVAEFMPSDFKDEKEGGEGLNIVGGAQQDRDYSPDDAYFKEPDLDEYGQVINAEARDTLEGMASVGDGGEGPPGPFDQAASPFSPNATIDNPTGKPPKKVVEEAVAKPAVVAGEKPGVAGEEPTTNGFGEFGTEYDESVDPVAANVRRILETPKVDETGQERPKTKEEFIKDFKESMPEYEGMSEEEKGFTIMEAGLKVMAGKSANAIENIAEGLKGVSKEFVKDKKAKRAFDQQINISSAKYALTGLETLRKEELASAKEGMQRKFKLIATADFTNDEGVLIKKGAVVLPTTKQLNEGFLDGKPLTFESTYLSDAKALASLATSNMKGRVGAQSVSESQQKYIAGLDSYKSSLSMKTILRESARLAAGKDGSGNVIGIRGYLKNAFDSALNAMGEQEGQETWSKKMAGLVRSGDKKKYDANQKRLGVAMATELLREGSKTLSDFDRKRVEELIADMVGTDGIFVSEKVLRSKLENLERVIDGNIKKQGAYLYSTEELWRRETTKGGTKTGPIFTNLRRRTLGSVNVGIGKGPRRSYNLSKIYDLNTRKFLPSFLKPGNT